MGFSLYQYLDVAMFFLPVADLLIANQPSLEQVQQVNAEILEEYMVPDTSIEDFDRREEEPLQFDYQIIPYVLEGSVEDFDPLLRAKSLSKTLPKKWCGSFTSFGKKSSKNVLIIFDDVKSIGQIVSMTGQMDIGDIKFPFQGHLNAKSDQMELLSTSDSQLENIFGAGLFMGLEGIQLSGWRPSNLQDTGGTLNLKKC